jgi:hypothetical protein
MPAAVKPCYFELIRIVLAVSRGAPWLQAFQGWSMSFSAVRTGSQA